MASSNPKVHELTSRLTDPRSARSDPDDDEELFAQLEAEIENDDSAALRERGLGELKQEMEKLQGMKASGHGRYEEIIDEKVVIRLSAHEPRCVIHFYHSKFRRCEIMDKHLSRLASKYFGTLFIRVFVENVPWLVEKLGIKVLPCVVCFVDGVSKSRFVGFEDLGNSDDFETRTLEWKMLQNGIIEKAETSGPQITYSVKPVTGRRIRGSKNDDDDFEFDLDD
ncbi:hypothetical protein QCA50_000568 [Cerrena zonata]|uniref:Thioredoxin-like protein n=1 Tax=Cerrena zonata TaxID=2478898 RepID=A0AAW0GX05_9APHY